ncbi:hypothetical protein [Janibacter melonis]|uniref:hypothetical protein n=1 Tax=Janibacter melonis TaxID=262209 RepID=UPI001919FF63|nr:hypothetical protein [Janibacter melonis]
MGLKISTENGFIVAVNGEVVRSHPDLLVALALLTTEAGPETAQTHVKSDGDPRALPAQLLITTSSGARHLICNDPSKGGATVCRVTGARKEPGQDLRADLRRDEHPVELVQLLHVRIGDPASLVLRGLNPNPEVLTVRTTTLVVRVESLG